MRSRRSARTDASASLDDALRTLPLLTAAKIRPTLPKAWLPEGRDAKAELASGKIAIVERSVSQSPVSVSSGTADGGARKRRAALRLNPRVAERLSPAELGAYRDAVLWVPERGTGSCGAGDPEYGERLEGARLHLNSRQESDVLVGSR